MKSKSIADFFVGGVGGVWWWLKQHTVRVLTKCLTVGVIVGKVTLSPLFGHE